MTSCARAKRRLNLSFLDTRDEYGAILFKVVSEQVVLELVLNPIPQVKEEELDGVLRSPPANTNYDWKP